MYIKIIAIFIFIFVQGVFSHVYAESDNDGMYLYMGGRAIVDAMKVTGSDEATKGFKATTMQFGAGFSAGVYKPREYTALRFEIDYSYTMRSNSYYHAIMTNIYLQSAYKADIFAPYIMFGVGMNVFDPPFAVIESNLAFNTGAGVIVPLNDTWLLDFGFRYMQSNINFHVEGTQKVKNHNFYIGCLRKF